ncbi:MAG: tRNA (adenosine(37)-N6)-threonylcarbamoyltransferase complex ATPase subunit type 1 TsaE [Ignavibacteriae bacterium]|jgi:tRNA threonylcarbamoyladenosine biosynthesis protein TsaE|nr:tRNA (adenosine(37)-N6)-threonylcarbamoyltransferase complex ATPase subunit type 1 TsaE [Ignavibacteriota bacterium]
MILRSENEEETITAGEKFATGLKPGDVLGLEGELGSGKTRFVKGICRHFRVIDRVNSPTFILVNEYTGEVPDVGGQITIYHFDLYRIINPAELDTIGFNEYIRKDSIVIIEWCEFAEKYLGKVFNKVRFEHGDDENIRIIKF